MTGKILKGIGGFYYVKTAEKEIYECKARGKFRNNAIKPQIGDIVDIECTDEPLKASIVKIYERKNSFIRPPVSNIDTMIIVSALKNPMPDTMFIDKMLVVCEWHNVEAIVCFNKCDLTDNDFAEQMKNLYANAGYKSITVSTYNNDGIDNLKKMLYGKTTAFAGFSGVGKSSLLNAIIGKDNMQTGDVSKKLKRGKHTTRHLELFEAFDNNTDDVSTYIVDTPGFSMIDIPSDIKCDNLKNYFKEFVQFEDNCKFSGCIHNSNKFCGVTDALKNGLIAQSRYDDYLSLYEELKNKNQW